MLTPVYTRQFERDLNPSSCSQKLSCMISICYPFEKRDFDTTDSNKLYNIVFTILPGL